MPTDEAMNVSAERQPNARPARVDSLVVESAGCPLSFLPNKGQPRFYVLNLETVMSDLGVNYTKTESQFKEAQQIISDETDWLTQFRFEYISSHTQIKPEKRCEAKLFGHAATVIVAMERIASSIDPRYNVYNYLRIVPGTFFIDRFDIERFYGLDSYYNELSLERRLELFGPDADAKGFEQLALVCIGQQNSDRLIQQMANGYTATHWVCNAFKTFIATHFPAEYHLDVVRQVGDENAARADKKGHQLGSHRAAPALRVPRRRDIGQLPPCC